MEQCHTCRRQLTKAHSMIMIEGVRYCSDICRQRHRGKTKEERRVAKRKARRSALRKGLPLILVGSFLLLLPLVLLLVLLFTGHFGFIDLFGVVYFIPGGGILAVGIYNYKEYAPRSSGR